MNLRDPIDTEGSIDGHVSHMDLSIFNDGHLVFFPVPNAFFGEVEVKSPVDFFDDHIDPGE